MHLVFVCEMNVNPIVNHKYFAMMFYFISAHRNFSGAGSEVHQGRVCNGGRRVGAGSGAEHPGRRRNFQKICKKSMKNLEFLENFKRNFAIFQIFLKFYPIFGKSLEKYVEKFTNMH